METRNNSMRFPWRPNEPGHRVARGLLFPAIGMLALGRHYRIRCSGRGHGQRSGHFPDDQQCFQHDHRVRLIQEYDDNYGSVELHVAEPTPAAVKYGVPVEAEYSDDDGVPVWVLLHVRNGVMCELEICRADGRPLISPTSAERLEPFSVNYEAGIRIVKKAGPRD